QTSGADCGESRALPSLRGGQGFDEVSASGSGAALCGFTTLGDHLPQLGIDGGNALRVVADVQMPAISAHVLIMLARAAKQLGDLVGGSGNCEGHLASPSRCSMGKSYYKKFVIASL